MPKLAPPAPDDLIDAAVRLFASGGAGAITMASVCREAHLPSGTASRVFPDRPSLLAETWIRTTSRFHAVMIELLGEAPDKADAIAATIAGVDWFLAHPAEAVVLDAGRGSFDSASWPPALLERERRSQQAWMTRLDAASRRVAASLGLLPNEVRFALEDVPRAVVRPYLQSGRPMPFSTVGLASEIANRILTVQH